MSASVVVVGAGMGGLGAAAVLAARGFRVTLLERAEHVGGKIRQDTVVGRNVDAGPTVMTMRWALERVFQEAGADLDAHVSLTPLPLLARHHWPDGSSLDLHTDVQRSFQEIAGFAGAAEAAAYLAFCRYGEHLFELVGQPFLAGSKPSFGGLLALAGRIGPLAALGIDGHRTMAAALASFFRDPRLLQLFGRYATYVGSSPLTAPATLNVIAHVERLGVWSVDGGMASLPRALAAVARERGAVIRQGAEVASIEVRGRRAVGVRLVGGELIPADAVVFNGDVAALTSGLLGTAVRHAAPDTTQRSLSAITFSMVARVRGRPLARHTVFFANDAAQELAEIEREGVSSSPTVYVCAQDRGPRDLGAQHRGARDQDGEGEAPAGAERLFFIVNARADGAGRQWSEENVCSRVLAGLARRFGVSFEIEGCETTTPAGFGRRFPGTSGALYGPATTGMFSSLLRARERSRVPALYLCGGSAHPGPGVPMAATSGLLAARAVTEDLGSTSRSRATDTPGGMSTR